MSVPACSRSLAKSRARTAIATAMAPMLVSGRRRTRKTWTSLPESSARSTVFRVPFEVPSQNATSTSHASISRWLRAADFFGSAISSNEAGITWTGMPLARAVLVAAASTPLALPVMIEAPRGSEPT